MNNIKWLIALIAVFSLVSCNSESTEPQFETIVVKPVSLNSTVLATGVIKPKVGAEVRVGSRVSGIVKKLNVHVGDIVKKGELLASLDEVELKAQYNQAAANLENAKTVLKYAGIEKNRQEALLANNAVTKQSSETASRAYEVAHTQVAQVTATVDYAKIQLDYTRISAPIDGTVASVSTQEGETVAATFTSPTFLTIIDLKRLEVRAYVDETDISKVTVGQKTEFTVDTYPGVIFEGIVKAIYPKAEIIDNVVNYDVIIDISDNKDKILRPEMTATVNILNESLENVIAVPGKAITHKNGEDFVYLLKEGKPEERKVVTGVKSKSLTQIISGLYKNEKLIINK